MEFPLYPIVFLEDKTERKGKMKETDRDTNGERHKKDILELVSECMLE